MAQWIARRTSNPEVVGSSPIGDFCAKEITEAVMCVVVLLITMCLRHTHSFNIYYMATCYLILTEYYIIKKGLVAQWIKRLTTDQKIPGSNPGKLKYFA